MSVYKSLVAAKKEVQKNNPDLDKLNTLVDKALEAYLSKLENTK